MIQTTPGAEPSPHATPLLLTAGPTLLHRAEAEVDCARPGLPEDSEERRAAVLLLLVREGGVNVERLVARTRYPREFVSRCVRRLVDNGWLVDGTPRLGWADAGAASPLFWSDVGVALGRLLRREGEDGRLEWAPVRGWVKHFEYSAPPAREGEVGNHYREIPVYDPEPAAPVPDPPPVVDAPAPARRYTCSHLALPSVQSSHLRTAKPEPPFVAATRSTPAVGMLVDGWGGADWLG